MSTGTLNRAQGLAAALLWGTSFVATKAAIQEIQPVTLIVLRFALGIIVLATAVTLKRVWRRVSLRDLVALAILGMFSITVHQGLQATGLIYTSASSMAWLTSLTPIFASILAWFFLEEPFGIIKVLGLTIAFSGAVLVVTRGAITEDILHIPRTTGDLLALASSLNWAVVSVASKPMLKRLPPTFMMMVVMFLGWMLTLPFFALSSAWIEIPKLSAGGWAFVVFLGIFCSGFAYLFWYNALSGIEAGQAAAFLYLEPLVTVVVAAIVLSEQFSITSILGGLAILVGVILVNRPSRSVAAKRSEAPVGGE